MVDNDISLKEVQDLLLIDKDRLDQACMEQPEVFYRVSLIYARKVSLRDACKDNMQKVFANESANYRVRAIEKGEKVTEGRINEETQRSKAYVEASTEYLEAKEEAEIWSVLKESFLQRASMIKELCGLFIANYYSDLTIRGDSKVQDQALRGRRKEEGILRRRRSSQTDKTNS